MTHKSHRHNLYRKNGHRMPAHIAGWEIKIVSSSVQIKIVINGSVMKE